MTESTEFPGTFLPSEEADALVREHRRREALAALLTDAGVASLGELRAAIVESAGGGEPLGEIALRRGWIDEAGLARMLARQWELTYLDADGVRVDHTASAFLSQHEARRLEACPVGFDGDTVLVAVADPEESRFEEIRAELGRAASFAIVSKSGLRRLLEAPGEPVAAEEPDALLADVDRAAATMAGLRERVQQLARRQHEMEAELSDWRSQLEALAAEREAEQQERSRLQLELEQRQEQQRDLFAALKSKLDDVTRTLDDVG